ncbi:MAG: gliding motility-associated C-terminal domain-containing protein [Bacteroidales bacterium]|nr:gliding motility-associated C-terminal domain-containing protein [Bacteroidales bacterium]
MINKLMYHINKLLIMLVLFIAGGSIQINGQEEIGGIINHYAKVNSISPGLVIVSPAQASQFAAGDYVLLIQMQGVGIQTAQGSYGVNVQSLIGTPGAYEFLQLLSVNAGTGEIRFTRNVYINSYNPSGNVQLIRVPFYNEPVVTSTLSAQPWNNATGTGGVVAIMAGRKLTLNASIDVTGQGFAGAPGVLGTGECVSTNVTANSLDSYNLSWNNAGLKGEGVAIHDYNGVLLYPDHAKGQGRNFTGGGGGNGRFSGGGGGSNRGKGADGGIENALQCSIDPRDGGYGGMNIFGSIIQDGVFLGGGAGASTQASGSTASAGGSGGGIVFIIADSIDGNNNIIRAEGVTALNSVSDAGAGGGGAGGSIILSLQGFNSELAISANGGNGGTSPGGSGEGGGGGGGLIWFSTPSTPAFVTGASVANGTPAPTIPSEGLGELKYSYFPNLNGFLFNSIRSAETGNRIDSVCSNVRYGQLTGTQPVGGTPPYSYRWESSTVSAITGFTDAPGTNNQQHYTPPAELSETTWFRRVVTDFGAAITDVSLPVNLIVHQNIKNNIIADPGTLCYGQNASVLNSAGVISDGNGTYEYRWETSTDNLSFTDLPTATESYQPSQPLTQTTWYRRTVSSGACMDVSPSVSINVLNPVENNSILTPAQEICEGMTFINLEGTVAPTLSGGDNTYRYVWESSSDNSVWTAAAGVTSTAGYDPAESAAYFPGQQYFRRVVYSGSNDVCRNASEPVILTSYPELTSNTLVSADQTICSGSDPVVITGSSPLNGAGPGSYTFTWQDSTENHSWTDITGFTNGAFPDFTTPVLTDTVRYRRIVRSSACMSISNAVWINVHETVSDNTISLLSDGLADTTICSGSTPHRITGLIATGGTGVPGDFIYLWSSSPDNTSWTEIPAATGNEYQPGALTSTTWFRRRAVSGECISESEPVRITVLPVIANNTIAGDQVVCKSDIPALLTQAPGQSISGGSGSYSYLWQQSADGSSWVSAQGTNNSSDGSYQPPAMTNSMRYRRFVTSGAFDCCSSISNVLELVKDSLPEGYVISAGRDTILHSFDHIIQLQADPPADGGTGRWTLVNGSGSFDNDTDANTKVSGLSEGLNTFLWTVTRGACTIEDEIQVSVLNLMIPEGFSPNDDPGGYNNIFRINGLDLENQEAELTIINGAGTEVFRTSNNGGDEWINWDGRTLKGTEVPEGTYYYLLKLTSKGNGQIFKKSGFIVLKRY